MATRQSNYQPMYLMQINLETWIEKKFLLAIKV